jgi:NTP pyrophosphatase (non-canonical NTP hydrolase)
MDLFSGCPHELVRPPHNSLLLLDQFDFLAVGLSQLWPLHVKYLRAVLSYHLADCMLRSLFVSLRLVFITNPIAIQIDMSSLAVEYYERKFKDDKASAFIHLVREIGEIAFAMEKNNTEHAKLELTESTALLYYLASKYELDLDANMKSLYTKKLETLKTATKSP